MSPNSNEDTNNNNNNNNNSNNNSDMCVIQHDNNNIVNANNKDCNTNNNNNNNNNTTINANRLSKHPSPRSVMLSSSNDINININIDNDNGHYLEDEPFDCATAISTLPHHGTITGTGIRNSKSSEFQTMNPKSLPLQSPRRIVPVPVPVRAVKVPKSPSSSSHQQARGQAQAQAQITTDVSSCTKQKASSYRLRRMQLAQQRKWKEEYMERTVQSKARTRESDDERSFGGRSHRSRRSRQSASRNTHTQAHTQAQQYQYQYNTSKSKSSAIGKELLIDNAEGLEISISNHLQKTGFNSSLIPNASRYEVPYYDNHTLTHHHLNTHGHGHIHGHIHGHSNNNGHSNESYHDDGSIAMDTVSSLNSSHYASDDGMSLRGFRSKSVSSRSRKRTNEKKLPKTRDSGRDTNHRREDVSYADSLHPPLYVSSVKKVRKVSKKKMKEKQSSFQDDDMEDMDVNMGMNMDIDMDTMDSMDIDMNISLSRTTDSQFTDDDDDGNEEDKCDNVLQRHEYDHHGHDHDDDDDNDSNDQLIESKLLGKSHRNDTKSISIMSPFNSSVSIINRSVNKSVNPLDKTAVASNKLKGGPTTRSHTAPTSTTTTSSSTTTIDEKENDIPWFKPVRKNLESRKALLGNIDRERPIRPQLLDHHHEQTNDSPKEQPPSLSNAKSPSTLRRRRLQLYLSVPDDHDNDNDNDNSNDNDHDDNDNDNDNDNEDNDELETKEISFSRTIPLTTSPKCKTEKSILHDDEISDKDSSHPQIDLTAVQDALDTTSHVSVKSYRSALTYTTLKTCMTIEPSSAKEMERILKRKQRKIYLLHHALTCTYPHATDPDDESYIPCPEVRYCQALSTLVRHVQTCTFVDGGNGQACEIPGCREYKKMWNHYRRCVLRTFTAADSKRCRLCIDLWKTGKGDDDEQSI